MKRPGDNSLKPRALVLSLVGVLLLSAGVAAGYDALHFPQPLRSSAKKVGAAVQIGGRAASGLELRALVSTHGCSNPVRVALLLVPTTRFWQQHPARGWDRRLSQKGAWSTRLSRARVSVAIDGDGVHRPSVRQATLEELLLELRATPSGTHRPFGRLFTVTRLVHTGKRWIASMRLRAWPATHAAIVVSFAADWIAPRTQGTCYLQLPALLGIGAREATLAAEAAAGQRVQEATVATGAHGRVSHSPIDNASDVVSPGDGIIDPSDSMPPPQLLDAQRVGWACTRPPSTAHGGTFQSGQFELYRQRGVTQPYPAPVSDSPIGTGNDCIAAVVIQSGGEIRDGELLTAGLLIPLGIGLALRESLLRAIWGRIRRMNRRRHRAGRRFR
jgi:hypothetical protein